MNGFHLTSLENWNAIQKEELRPYSLERWEPAFRQAGFSPGLLGIYIWNERLDEASEWATVFWHVATKRTRAVVVLEIRYDAEDLLRKRETNQTVELHHALESAAGVRFHESSSATILKGPIQMRSVRLVKTYDLAQYVEIDEACSMARSRPKLFRMA